MTAFSPPDAFDAAAYRAATPGAANLIHLNAAGAALPSIAVTAAAKSLLDLESAIGPHWAAAHVETALAATRARAARLLACDPTQIAFGESHSRLWALLFRSVPFKRGRRILVSRGEWVGNLLNIAHAQTEFGVRIEILPSDADGRIDVSALRESLDEDVAVLAVTAVSSGHGARQPLDAIAAIERPADCLYFLDAAQVLGRFPLSLPETSADILTAPSRKWLRGPRGQSLAALSERALRILRFPVLPEQTGTPWTGNWTFEPRSDACRFETFEYSLAARLGLGVALAELLAAGPHDVAVRIDRLVQRAANALQAIPGVYVLEDPRSRPAFLTFTCDGVDPASLVQHLADENIAICQTPSSYAPLEMTGRAIDAVLRVSPHAYVSDDDIDRFAATVGRVVDTELGRRRSAVQPTG